MIVFMLIAFVFESCDSATSKPSVDENEQLLAAFIIDDLKQCAEMCRRWCRDCNLASFKTTNVSASSALVIFMRGTVVCVT